MKTTTLNNFSKYSICENGTVKNIETGRILKQSKQNEYLQLNLVNDQHEVIHFTLHQLLTLAFIGNYDTDTQMVDHIDNNKSNNSLENLRIVTTRENSLNRKDQSVFGANITHSKSGKYDLKLQVKGKVIYLASYDTNDNAIIRQKYEFERLNNLEQNKTNYTYTINKLGYGQGNEIIYTII